MPSNTMQKVNSFALRAFRDTADKDYIHARLAYKSDLFPQFQWSALHALEKYAKCILILTRTPKPTKRDGFIGHEVKKSLVLISEKIEIHLSDQTLNFIDKLERFGAQYRYLEVSWFVRDCELAFLDRAVWELRRFCDAEIFEFHENKFISIKPEKYNQLKCIDTPRKDNTFINDGFLEKVLEKKNSNIRANLIWCNLFYSSSNRKRVRIKSSFMAENSPFYLYPEIIDEVAKYTFVPKEIIKAYKDS